MRALHDHRAERRSRPGGGARAGGACARRLRAGPGALLHRYAEARADRPHARPRLVLPHHGPVRHAAHISCRLAATHLNFSLFRPLRQLPFALLWAGMATAAIGDQLFAVVLSWVAVGLFGTAAGYLTATMAGATLTTALFAGRWADRVEPRRMMICADISRAGVLLVVVAVWIARGEPAAWSLVLCVLVLAAGNAVFRPALQATVPALAGDSSLLPAANALLDTTERIARLLGPGLVGMASGFFPLVHFVSINVATFLASALAVFSITRLRRLPHLVPAGRAGLLANVVHGFMTVRRHKVLAFVLTVNGAVNGAWYASYFLGLPLMLGRGGEGLAAYGTVISTYGALNLLSTLVVGSRGAARR